MIKVVLLSGPTGVGKTRIAQRLCKALNAEIISCDSVQVFKELNIGSNKERLVDILPSGEELLMPQHLVDLVSWKQDFSVGDYYEACMNAIKSISAAGKLPLVVGGTGFYMNWILRGRAASPSVPEEFYEASKRELQGKSWSEALEDFKKVDPKYAQTLSNNDFYRLERAWAVYKYTGKPNSSFYYPNRADLTSVDHNFDFRCFYISKDRVELMRLIDWRCEDMLKRGLLDEVAALLKDGFHKSCTAGRAIGYYQTLELFEKAQDVIKTANGEGLSQLLDGLVLQYIKDFQAASRSYSRRQDHWFGYDLMFNWANWENFGHSDTEMLEFLGANINLSRDAWHDKAHTQSLQRFKIHENSWNLRFEPGKAEKETRTYNPKLTIFSTTNDRRPLIESILQYMAP